MCDLRLLHRSRNLINLTGFAEVSQIHHLLYTVTLGIDLCTAHSPLDLYTSYTALALRIYVHRSVQV